MNSKPTYWFLYYSCADGTCRKTPPPLPQGKEISKSIHYKRFISLPLSITTLSENTAPYIWEGHCFTWVTSVFPWLSKVCSINKVGPPFKSLFSSVIILMKATKQYFPVVLLALGFLLPPWFWFILRFLHVWRQCNWNKKLKVVKPCLTPTGFVHELVFFTTKSLEICSTGNVTIVTE